MKKIILTSLILAGFQYSNAGIFYKDFDYYGENVDVHVIQNRVDFRKAYVTKVSVYNPTEKCTVVFEPETRNDGKLDFLGVNIASFEFKPKHSTTEDTVSGDFAAIYSIYSSSVDWPAFSYKGCSVEAGHADLEPAMVSFN
ncbi:MAG: hypothetical protein Kow0076_2240 [Francisella sp.]